MYQFNSSDIKTFRSSKYYKRALEIFDIALPKIEDKETVLFSREALEMIKRGENKAKIIERYPMSYFAPTMSKKDLVDRKQKEIEELTNMIEYGEERILKLNNSIKNLKKSGTVDDKDKVRLQELSLKLKDSLRCYESFEKGIQSIKNIDPYTDIFDRDMFINASTSVDSPAWWTWLHFCNEMSAIVVPSILRSNYSKMNLWLCKTPSHTFVSNTYNVKVIRELCNNPILSRDITRPLIFDMIQQVYAEEKKITESIYEGKIQVCPLFL